MIALRSPLAAAFLALGAFGAATAPVPGQTIVIDDGLGAWENSGGTANDDRMIDQPTTSTGDPPRDPLVPRVPPAQRDRRALPETAASAPTPEAEPPLRGATRIALLSEWDVVDRTTTRRLPGEESRAAFVLVLPEAAAGATSLRLVHRSSINVLPERSLLRITVNGTDVAEIVPTFFEGFGESRVELPPGTLNAGMNTVAIAAQHTHRVFCGVEASFELWTDLDTARSGVDGPVPAFPTTAAGFAAALAAQTASGRPATVTVDDLDGADRGALIALLSGLSGQLGTIGPRWDVTRPWLVSQGAPDHARIALLPAGSTTAAPGYLRGGDGAVVFVLPEDSDADAVREMFANAPGATPPEQARGPGPGRMTPGRPAPLGALDHDGLTGSGHYIVMSVDFRLPRDWLLIANQEARLDLVYRFAADLPTGALLQVKVNGTTVRLLPLDRGGGEALPTLPIAFPARLLHPGVNRLEFEALIPAALTDQACPPHQDATLRISEDSTLTVPSAPRMSLADLGTALAGLRPQAVSLSEQAARAFPPQMAVRLPIAIGASRPAEDIAIAAPSLTVVAPADFAALYPSYAREDIRALQDALFAPQDASASPEPEAARSDPWQAVPERRLLPSIEQISAPLDAAARRLQSAIGGRSTALSDWLGDRKAEAILLLAAPVEAPGRVWLAVAPDTDPGGVLHGVAAARDRFDGPRGQVAVLTADGRWVHWAPANPSLRLLEPITLGNAGLVAGNYATARPRVFVTTLLALAAMSALVALAILLILRGRRQ